MNKNIEIQSLTCPNTCIVEFDPSHTSSALGPDNTSKRLAKKSRNNPEVTHSSSALGAANNPNNPNEPNTSNPNNTSKKGAKQTRNNPNDPNIPNTPESPNNHSNPESESDAKDQSNQTKVYAKAELTNLKVADLKVQLKNIKRQTLCSAATQGGKKEELIERIMKLQKRFPKLDIDDENELADDVTLTEAFLKTWFMPKLSDTDRPALGIGSRNEKFIKDALPGFLASHGLFVISSQDKGLLFRDTFIGDSPDGCLLIINFI